MNLTHILKFAYLFGSIVAIFCSIENCNHIEMYVLFLSAFFQTSVNQLKEEMHGAKDPFETRQHVSRRSSNV